MFGWLREILEIKAEFRERKRETSICESCDTLRTQLSMANEEKKLLLARLLEPPKSEVIIQNEDKPIPFGKQSLPWKARQQALEAEDRARARVIREVSASKVSTEDLEKELNVAAKEREEANGNRAIT